MAPSQKGKGDDGPSSPNKKRARKKVVSDLVEKVYEAQLLKSPNVDGQKDHPFSCCSEFPSCQKSRCAIANGTGQTYYL
jgi:hypothetical protein